MNCVGSGAVCNFEDQIAAQVALRGRRRAQAISLVSMKHVQRGAVGIGVDRYRPQSHLAAGSNHPQRDLTAIGNQNFVYGSSQAAILSQEAALRSACCFLQKKSLSALERLFFVPKVRRAANSW